MCAKKKATTFERIFNKAKKTMFNIITNLLVVDQVHEEIPPVLHEVCVISLEVVYTFHSLCEGRGGEKHFI